MESENISHIYSRVDEPVLMSIRKGRLKEIQQQQNGLNLMKTVPQKTPNKKLPPKLTNLLSSMECENQLHLHIYTWIRSCALACIQECKATRMVSI